MVFGDCISVLFFSVESVGGIFLQVIWSDMINISSTHHTHPLISLSLFIKNISHISHHDVSCERGCSL